MKVTIVGKNITVTKALEDKINEKLKGLDKYFIIDDNDVAKVLLRTYPTKQKIEITIPTKFAILRTETSADDMYTAIDKAVDKLKDQIRRQKTRVTRKSGKPLYEAFLDYDILGEPVDEEVVRTKTVIPERMSLDEAITKMDLLDHSFFVFRSSEDDSLCIVYQRKNGGYGLIVTDEEE